MKIKTNLMIWLLALGSLMLQPVWAEVPAPQLLIKQTADHVIEAIKANKDLYQAEPATLYAMVDEKVLKHFDFDRMTNLALGKYKRRVKKEQKSQLVNAFRTLLVRTYAKALLEYNDQQIVFLPMRGNLAKGDVTVRTEVEQKGGFPIPINYAMSSEDGQWKVYDLSIDNISLVTNYRSSFAREIKSKGVDSLINTLLTKNQEETK